jgi:hypothetical protein
MHRLVLVVMLLCSCEPGPYPQADPEAARDAVEPAGDEQARPHVEAQNGTPVDPEGTALGCAGDHLLSLTEDGQVVSVRGDGTINELYQLGAAVGVASDGVVVQEWQVQGPLLATVAFLYAPPTPHRYEFLVIDGAGSIR